MTNGSATRSQKLKKYMDYEKEKAKRVRARKTSMCACCMCSVCGEKVGNSFFHKEKKNGSDIVSSHFRTQI